ncbi:hypothetical protein [Halorussus halophilus]|uniref:hypothetical protein n=1 Tax=Halorussus halophilus TaxID=2650975 RepID=UPI0013014E0E|nr:hypothetical protein [Halorussus halophilus]
MQVNIYTHDRCGRCGDILHALQDRNIEYHGHQFPPDDSDIDALSGDMPEPVLVDEERAPEGIVGHDEILEWIENEYAN